MIDTRVLRVICISLAIFFMIGMGHAANDLLADRMEVGERGNHHGLNQVVVAMGRKNPRAIRHEPVTNSVGMKFVWIPPGSFMMGSPDEEPRRDPEETLHRVTLTKGFFVQETEVTQGQWQAVMENNPSEFKNCGENCPVENVSWNDVQAFIWRLNQKEGAGLYRLPTEAEWEYVCRAGTGRPFSFGYCLGTDQANYEGNYPLTGCAKGEYRRKPLPVASLSPNPWRIFDLHGNVSEWCQDKYGKYSSHPVSDPVGPGDGSFFVIRGGGWRNGARLCRSAVRSKGPPEVRSDMVGFRLIREHIGR